MVRQPDGIADPPPPEPFASLRPGEWVMLVHVDTDRPDGPRVYAGFIIPFVPLGDAERMGEPRFHYSILNSPTKVDLTATPLPAPGFATVSTRASDRQAVFRAFEDEFPQWRLAEVERLRGLPPANDLHCNPLDTHEGHVAAHGWLFEHDPRPRTFDAMALLAQHADPAEPDCTPGPVWH